MISTYIKKWLDIIENMNNDNTYKLAWGRAILECISFNRFVEEENTVIINLLDISECILKYYWNQLFFFNLKQSPYIDKSVVMCSFVEKLINEYKHITNSTIPVWFDEGKKVLKENNNDLYVKTVKEISKVSTWNVAYRFKHLKSEVVNIYEPYKPKDKIYLNKNDVSELKDYSVILSKLLNYKWAQLLEQYNIAPKISSKVNGISEAKLKRHSLSKYKEELLKQFGSTGKIIDFYTGQELNRDNISIDHVIPWSFMYSDDIWNLVITSKSTNSSKSNSIPSDEVIEKLKQRNKELERMKLLDEKYEYQLEEANKNNYVDKFYYESRI